MYVGSDYQLYLQSLAGFIIIGIIFVPFLKWAFTSKSHRQFKKEQKEIRRDLKRLRRK
jgi:hypothetical protein